MSNQTFTSTRTMWKKQFRVATSHCFRANPRGKPPINALQMRTFDTVELECNCRVFQDMPLSIIKVMYLPFLFNLDDNHWRDSMEQWYKRLVVTCKNGVWSRKRKSFHNVICLPLFLQTRLCCCISHSAHDSCIAVAFRTFEIPKCVTRDWEMRERVGFHP